MKEKFKNSALYNNWARQDLMGKLLYLSLIILLLGFLFYVCAYCVGSILKPFVEIFSDETRGAIYYAISTPFGLSITLLVFVAFNAFIIFSAFKNIKTNQVVATDDRGINYMKNGTEGTSKWLSKEEAREVFNVFDIDDIDNPKDDSIDYTTSIYGQFSTNGKEVCGFKRPKFGGEGDRNTFIIGSPGTGKSYAYVRTELIQTVRRGHSFVVTDPSGELYSSLANYCKENDYDVKVLNLAEPEYSDFWDCLEETLNPDTQRLDASRLNEFISIYMENTQEPNAPKDFWYVSACNILRVIIGWCAWKRELGLITNLRVLFQKIVSKETDPTLRQINNNLIRDMDAKNRIGLNEIKERIRSSAIKYNFPLQEVDELITDIEKKSPPFNIGLVFECLLDSEKILLDSEFKEIPSWHPAKSAYLIYQSNNTATVKGSAIQGTQNRLQIFSDPNIKDVLSYEGIHLNQLNARKSAYFIIMSDKSNATKSISSLFFSFLFKDTQDCWDKAQQKANSEINGKNPLLPVTVMLDEFFSIGVIGGDKDQFAVTMSNSRKRRLYISIIVQSYLQPESLYGHANATTIQNCCGTIIFLGCNDPETAKFISEFASGDATVMNESHREKDGLISYTTTPDIGISTKKRALLTVDEARRWRNKVLVVKAGTHPLELNPFPWSDHPDASKMKPTNIYQAIERISDRKNRLHIVDLSLDELKKINSSAITEITQRISRMKQCDPDLNIEYLDSVIPKITKEEMVVAKPSSMTDENIEQQIVSKKKSKLDKGLNIFKRVFDVPDDYEDDFVDTRQIEEHNLNTETINNLSGDDKLEELSKNENDFPLIETDSNDDSLIELVNVINSNNEVISMMNFDEYFANDQANGDASKEQEQNVIKDNNNNETAGWTYDTNLFGDELTEEEKKSFTETRQKKGRRADTIASRKNKKNDKSIFDQRNKERF